MKVEVTVYLKSGGEIVSSHFGETVQTIAEHHAKIFTNKNLAVAYMNVRGIIHVVPEDNIASISVMEVTE